MTQAEGVGYVMASHAVATAALVQLIKLGHHDLFAGIEATALDTLNRNLGRSEGLAINKDVALRSGRQAVRALIAYAEAGATLDKALRL